MTWVAWRQHRSELLIAMAILAAMTAFLIPTGLERHDLFEESGLNACLSAGRDCLEVRGTVLRSYDSLSNITPWFNFVPAIVGILLAAPLIAEFEQRTHRLAWTQSITRERWLATKLVVALAGVVLFAVALTVVMTWWHAPLDRADVLAGKDLGNSFDFEGVMPFAYTLFALSLALAAGALSRRLLIALPGALVAFVVLRLSIMEVLRPNVDISIGPGEELSVIELTRDMDYFWTIQAIEGGIFVTASVILLGLTALVVRRST